MVVAAFPTADDAQRKSFSKALDGVCAGEGKKACGDTSIELASAPASAFAESAPIAASISSWKISGRPVTHSINRNTVGIRPLHLWIRYQILIVPRDMARRLAGLAYPVNANNSQ